MMPPRKEGITMTFHIPSWNHVVLFRTALINSCNKYQQYIFMDKSESLNYPRHSSSGTMFASNFRGLIMLTYLYKIIQCFMDIEMAFINPL